MGVEFLIDEQLVLQAPSWSAYHTALHFGASATGGLLAWRNDHDQQRFTLLCRRLAALSHARDGVPALVKRLFGSSPTGPGWLSTANMRRASKPG